VPDVAGTVLYELDADRHVVTITYNRPDALNAINGEMRGDLNEAFARFRDDEAAWIAIVTGAGRAFCAGADLRGEGNSAGDFPGTFWEKPTQNSFESGWEIFKPVIAAVNGHCLGYGFTLVTWCDFVIASERATFGFPEVRIGVPTIVGAIRLPQRIGWQAAMEILLTGERIDADRATPGELARLPRVGLALAKTIVADRETRGPFGALEQLDRVPGIGPGLLAAIGSHVTFSARPVAPASGQIARPGAHLATGLAAHAPAPPTPRLNLNSASVSELDELPGIGPARAAAILQEREARGPFTSVEELSRVPGLGPSAIARLRDRVVVR
jgi:competence ComEA-like helix-hairpin-helix protein